MSQPSPKEIIDGFEAARAKNFVYMAQALVDEFGEERVKQVTMDTGWKKSKTSARVRTGEPGSVEEYVLKMFRSNYMTEPVGIFRSTDLSQCYRCGYD